MMDVELTKSLEFKYTLEAKQKNGNEKNDNYYSLENLQAIYKNIGEAITKEARERLYHGFTTASLRQPHYIEIIWDAIENNHITVDRVQELRNLNQALKDKEKEEQQSNKKRRTIPEKVEEKLSNQTEIFKLEIEKLTENQLAVITNCIRAEIQSLKEESKASIDESNKIFYDQLKGRISNDLKASIQWKAKFDRLVDSIYVHYQKFNLPFSQALQFKYYELIGKPSVALNQLITESPLEENIDAEIILMYDALVNQLLRGFWICFDEVFIPAVLDLKKCEFESLEPSEQERNRATYLNLTESLKNASADNFSLFEIELNLFQQMLKEINDLNRMMEELEDSIANEKRENEKLRQEIKEKDEKIATLEAEIRRLNEKRNVSLEASISQANKFIQ